jgi:phospholipase/carboxylesterase
MLECKTIPAAGTHRRTAIWFHGVGETAEVYLDLAQRLELSKNGVRSLVPLAPDRHLSMTGKQLSAWFQQAPFELFEADPASLDAAANAACLLVRQEALCLPAENIVLCGFSQGAVLAMIVGLRYPERLGGVALFAPYLLNQSNLRTTRSTASLRTPIWIGHGRDDLVVPASLAKELSDCLSRSGYAVDLNFFAGGHDSLCGVSADALGEFLLPAAGQSRT